MKSKVRRSILAIFTLIVMLFSTFNFSTVDAAKKHDHKGATVTTQTYLGTYYCYKIPKVGLKRFSSKQKNYAKYYTGTQGKYHRYIKYKDGCIKTDLGIKWR